MVQVQEWLVLKEDTILYLQDGDSKEEVIWFEFQKTKYIYDHEEKKQFQAVAFPVDYKFKRYLEWKGYVDAEEDGVDRVAKAKRQYGDNG